MKTASAHLSVFGWGVPLTLGLMIGTLFAQALGADIKNALAVVAGLSGVSILLVLGFVWPAQRLHDMLFVLTVFSLALTFIDNNFGFRTGWPFVVLVNGFRVALSDVILLLLAVLWWFQRDERQQEHRGQVHLPPAVPRWLSGLFLASLLWGAFNSAFIAREPFFAWSVWWRELKIVLILYFLAHFMRERHFRLMGYAFAAAVVLQFLAVLDQKFFGPVVFTAQLLKTEFALKSIAGSGYIMRYSGTMGHPNTLANFLLVAILWIWFMIPTERRRWVQFALLGAVVLAFITVVFTGSRGGWLGLALAMTFGIVAWMKRTGKNLVVGMFAALVTISAVTASLWTFSETFRDRLTKDDRGSALVRQPLNEIALNVIAAQPLTGVGYGQYTSVMKQYDTTNLRVTSWFEYMVHNWALLTAAEIGVPGLLLHLTIVLSMLAYGWQVFRHGTGMFADAGLTTIGATIGWLIQQMTNPDYYFMPVYLWFAWAAMLAARRMELQHGWRPA